MHESSLSIWKLSRGKPLQAILELSEVVESVVLINTIFFIFISAVNKKGTHCTFEAKETSVMMNLLLKLNQCQTLNHHPGHFCVASFLVCPWHLLTLTLYPFPSTPSILPAHYQWPIFPKRSIIGTLRIM